MGAGGVSTAGMLAIALPDAITAAAPRSFSPPWTKIPRLRTDFLGCGMGCRRLYRWHGCLWLVTKAIDVVRRTDGLALLAHDAPHVADPALFY